MEKTIHGKHFLKNIWFSDKWSSLEEESSDFECQKSGSSFVDEDAWDAENHIQQNQKKMIEFNVFTVKNDFMSVFQNM